MNFFSFPFRHGLKPGILLLISILFFNVPHGAAQDPLYKVLTLTGRKTGARDLPQDNGAAGLYQRLLKLQTIGSVLHTQAHPDDEHADMLTLMGRGLGYRTALLSLNRGESGANALGSEAFDQLGVLRTEEFLLAAAYYGLDDLYFTRLADYGYSKTVAETYQKWGRENILKEVVRVIRINRPLVVVSRFHGSTRDGHGNHQAAGELTPLAVQLAGDSTAFPELLREEGLRPWRPLRMYRGGIRPAAGEKYHAVINTGAYSPLLGSTFKNFSLLGYSLHRSQTSGTRNEVAGPFELYYEQLHPAPGATMQDDFFAGLDTKLTGIFTITGEQPPAGITPLLQQISSAVHDALRHLRFDRTDSTLQPLLDGLKATRAALGLLHTQPEARFLLQLKEQQFIDAIHLASGMDIQAIAEPAGAAGGRGFFEPQHTMAHAVAGHPFVIKTVVENNSRMPVQLHNVKLSGSFSAAIDTVRQLDGHQKWEHRFGVTLPDSAPFSQPYYHRASIQEPGYQLVIKQYDNLPHAPAALQASLTYRLGTDSFTLHAPVQVRQANLPFGYDLHILKVVPRLAVNAKTRMVVLPLQQKNKTVQLDFDLLHNTDTATSGALRLHLPAGWTSKPAFHPFAFSKSGEKNNYSFTVSIPRLDGQDTIEAVATVGGATFRSGYHLIHYRDLDQQMMYYPAQAVVRAVDVRIVPGLRVGYVMGAGDEVPQALRQLGTEVQLLTGADLATGQLNRFDAIMIGIRAYAVRQDLNTYNSRLLDYARNGGHLIVLYQTPEYIPNRMAPFAASLPPNAEEISEEDAPVTLLDPGHPALQFPNHITLRDFDNWVEQRGSKFFSAWDSRYTPILASQDQGQQPQKGGWLMASSGKGHFTYFAYALHRQLPYGVAGAYRLLANLVSYGKNKEALKNK